ncbi:hypothetical protein DU475_08070 [Rhodopseudomonas sp. WA056]|uniref:hypothetical protein n=1 Tax=Rhodopseudomonas sp. WA056 TaxID=2269367 RepID=UPI001967E157|nr:hypothetical protein [Rhodopseudomonas sp. WA056]NEW87216.1 hypothetical protein [Rhodopseudomonas sp. WA056]
MTLPLDGMDLDSVVAAARSHTPAVIAGRDPAIHLLAKEMDARAAMRRRASRCCPRMTRSLWKRFADAYW